MIPRALTAASLLLALGACNAPTQLDESPLPVVLKSKPLPFPFSIQGLAFQMQPLNFENATQTKPIGTGLLGPDGEVFLSFPHKNLLLCFRPPEYQTTYYGPEYVGGTGEPVIEPAGLFLVDHQLLFTNKRNGVVTALSLDGKHQGQWRLQQPNPICGPGPAFFVRSTQGGTAMKLDQQGRELVTYATPFAQADALAVDDQWRVWRFHEEAEGLTQYNAEGKPELRFSFEWSALHDVDPQALAVSQAASRTWLLLGNKAETRSWMLVLAPGGLVVHWWALPFAADGFDLNDTHILLYRRNKGSAALFRRF